MTVYKAVRQLNGAYCSCVIQALGFKLRYQLWEITRPTAGKLFGYLDAEKAKSFARSYGGMVLVGESDNVEDAALRNIPDSGDTAENLLAFWLGNGRLGYGMAPSGTVLIPEFMPESVYSV